MRPYGRLNLQHCGIGSCELAVQSAVDRHRIDGMETDISSW